MARARRTQLVSMVILATAICASAEVRKEFRFTVGPRSVISITNQYGPISVKPGAGTQVIVTAVLHSDQVEVDHTQSGNRVDILTHLLSQTDADTGRVDYEVSVPADASVTMRSSTGLLHAEGLHGDAEDIARVRAHLRERQQSRSGIALGVDGQEGEGQALARPEPLSRKHLLELPRQPIELSHRDLV